MIDSTSTVVHRYPVPAGAPDHLDRLVSRISAGDRLALRCLYAFLAARVWRTAARALPHPGHALAVTRSTFLEVWHTAGAAAHYDARDWIEAITAYQIDERRRLRDEPDRHGPHPGSASSRDPAVVGFDHDAHTRRELAALLGTGRATIRVSPATFIRVDDLDRALDTIASTTRRRARHPARAHHQDRAVNQPA
jgi:hypothetical protein